VAFNPQRQGLLNEVVPSDPTTGATTFPTMFSPPHSVGPTQPHPSPALLGAWGRGDCGLLPAVPPLSSFLSFLTPCSTSCSPPATPPIPAPLWEGGTTHQARETPHPYPYPGQCPYPHPQTHTSCECSSVGRSGRCAPVNHKGCTAPERCSVPLHVPAGHTVSKIILCTQKLGGPAVRICSIFSAVVHKTLAHGPSQ